MSRKRNDRRFSIIIGLALVLSIFAYSMVTIQGTGAWFTQAENLDDVGVSIGTMALDAVYVGDISFNNLIPSSGPIEDKWFTVNVTNEQENSTTDFYYKIEFNPVSISDLWSADSDLMLEVFIGDDEVYSGRAYDYDRDYTDFSILRPGDTEEVSINFWLTTSDQSNSFMDKEVTVAVTVSAKQVDGVEVE